MPNEPIIDPAPVTPVIPVLPTVPPVAPAVAAPAVAAPVAAPVAYELTLPEGSHLDAADLGKITTYAKTHNLTKDQANALIGEQSAIVTGVVLRQQATADQLKSQWAEQVRGDKDLGGAKLNVTLTEIKRVMDKFAPADSGFRKLLDETGYGNHPEFVRFVAQIGRAMGEDNTLLTPHGNTPASKKSAAEILYGG